MNEKPRITDEEVTKELHHIANQAGKAISSIVAETMADEMGNIKFSPDKFMALQLGYTMTAIDMLIRATQEVTSNVVVDAMLMSKDLSDKNRKILQEIKDRREKDKK